jgi:hypothetical protein
MGTVTLSAVLAGLPAASGELDADDVVFAAEDGVLKAATATQVAAGAPGIVMSATAPSETDVLWADTSETGTGFVVQPVASDAEAITGTANDRTMTPASTVAASPFRRMGGVGDGTTNDTAAVAATIAAVIAAGGGDIIVPNGKTFYTDMITLAGVSVPLRFTGGGTLKFRTANSSLIRVDANTATITIEGVTLDGNSVAMSNNQSALVRAINAATHPVIVRGCELKNSAQNGISAVSGGRLIVTGNHIHDCGADGIRILTTLTQTISNNYIRDCGLGGIRLQPSAAPGAMALTEGCTVSGNVIRNVRDDIGDNGPYGNGINVYRLGGVSITGNAISTCEWSFIRMNDADHSVITGNACHHNDNDPGIFCEFGARHITVSGNTIEDARQDGIVFANVADGAVGLIANGNNIKGFGAAGTASGIVISCGMAVGNYIDGGGVAGAVWGVRLGTSGGIATSEYRTLVVGNQIAGVKYALALGASSTSGTKDSLVVANQVTRQDASWSGPIGVLGGGNTDGGDGSGIGAAAALTLYLADNNFDIPTAHTPQPFATGSRVKINGILNVSDGVRWVAPRNPLKGNTASRPTLTAAHVGAMHLDTTLGADGKPIWWTGTAWVDATGATV